MPDTLLLWKLTRRLTSLSTYTASPVKVGEGASGTALLTCLSVASKNRLLLVGEEENQLKGQPEPDTMVHVRLNAPPSSTRLAPVGTHTQQV